MTNEKSNKKRYRRKKDEVMSQEEFAKSYQYGNNLELVTAPTSGFTIRKIDADHYADANGEVHEFQKSETKAQNVSSVAQTMKRLRRLIVNNFDGGQDQLWCTLTYAENMQDTKRLYADFQSFIRTLRRQFGNIEYIMVIEPQARGAWHCHVLLKTDDGRDLYIENSKLRQIWGHGFVNVKRLHESDNVAAYVMAYLNDLPVEEASGGKIKSKQILKGARLSLYPTGVNFYRFSRGIKKPTVKQGSKAELQELYSVTDEDSVFYNQRTFKTETAKGDTLDLTFKTEIFRIGEKENGKD